MVAWKKSKFKSVFLLNLFLHYWFFLNLQMSTEWKFAFLNTAIIIFCLMYSLNTPHSNQNLSFFLLKDQYQSLLYISATSHRTVIRGELVTRKYFYISFLVTMILPLSRETDLSLVLVTNAKYIACLSFPDPQTKFNWVKHDWTSIFWQWINRKHFLFERSNIWNSKVGSYNKTTCFLRRRCFIKDLFVTPV